MLRRIFPMLLLGSLFVLFAQAGQSPLWADAQSASAPIRLPVSSNRTEAGPSSGSPTPQPTTSLVVRQRFIVTEKNPITAELVGKPKRFESRLEAATYRESISTGVWVVWRIVGQNEPLRTMRFENRALAEVFLGSSGPARRGLLGSLLLTNETRLLPARVTLESEFVRP